MMNTRTVRTYLASMLRSAVSSLCWLPVLLLTIGVGICPASVVTAHFSGAQIALGGGFSQPRGVAVDSSGNVYVADSAHNQVKEIPAGCFSLGCTQQLGGSYVFNSPKGMAVDAGGNVYVADSSNNKIEVMTPNCTDASCVTQLGTGYGFNGPTAVAVDAAGNVFVADYSKSTVEEMTPGCHNSGCVTQIGSGWSQPDALAVDASGNVYVSDDNRSPVGVYEMTAASSYTAVSQIAVGFGFSSPRGVALDSAGNMFVSDAGLNAVEEITFGSGYSTVITLASNYSSPRGVAVDANDNVYIGDYGNNAVEEVKRSNASFGTVNIGSTSAAPITLIFGFDTGGTVQAPAVLTQGMTGLDFTAASGGTCAAATYGANTTCTVNVAFAPQGSGTRYGAAVLRNSGGAAIATGYVFGTGVGPQVAFLPSVESQVGSGVLDPHGIQADASGNLYVADTGGNEIVEILAPGYGALNVLGGGFSQPRGVAVDGAGNVFVGDGGNRAVKEIPLGCVSSTCVVTLGGGFNFSDPFGVAVDGNGNVFAADYGANSVYEILAAGGYTTVIRLASSFGFYGPYGIAVDGSGNVFVADEDNSAVREILAAGGYATVNTLGSGFLYPRDVAVDGSGNVYVADGGHDAVKEILAASGYVTVQTLASGLTSTPEGVAVDGAGNVYDAIAGYTYLLKEGYSGAPTFNFNATNVGLLSTDSPQSVTLLNNGNAPLLIPVPNSGVNPGFWFTSYTLDAATTCPVINAGGGETGALAAGDSCVLAVDFTPASSGANNDALVLTDNNLNAPGPVYASQGIALNGTGTVPAPPPQTTPTITWTPPAAINFGSDLTSVLTAMASVPGSYAYTATPAGGTAAAVNTATILAPASYILGLTFTPADQIDYTTATAAAPLTVNASFGGTGIGSPSVTPMTVTFQLNGAPGNGTLASPLVLTQGAPGLDFTDAGTGSCTAGAVYSGGITCTVGVTFAPKYAGTRYGAVVLTDSTGAVVATQYITGTGLGPQVNFQPGTQSTVTTSSLWWPFGVAVDGSGSLYIADAVNNRVLKETLGSGSYSETMIAAGLLSQPAGVAVDGAGNVYIADGGNGRVLMAPWTGSGYGSPVTVASAALNGVGGPEGVAVDGSGNVYIADTHTNRVLQIPWTGSGYGAVVTVANAALNGLNNPDGVAVDGSGNVYVADTGNSQVLQFPWTGSGYGAAVTVANAAQNGLNGPYGIAVDGMGNVYVADTMMGRVVKETLSGGSYTQSILAGGLVNPEGVAVDGSGNVYLTDSGIGLLRKEDFADAPAVAFPTPTAVGSADTADGAQIVTVENIGNQPLIFSVLSYPADFPETGASDCAVSTPLAAGAVCPLTIGFLPTTSGNLSEPLVVWDNSLNAVSTSSVVLTGTGTAPAPPPQTTPTITWAPPSAINFGSDLSSVLTAVASVPGNFAYTATPAGGTATPVTAATILAPAGYTLTASFSPADMVDYTTATASVPLTVNANFGGVGIGSPSPTAMTLTVTIDGSLGNGTLGSPLVLTQGAPGLDFTDATTGTCTGGTNYSGGISCTVNVTFAPKYAGTRYGAVVLTDSAGTVVATQYISGTGTGAQVNFFLPTIPNVLLPGSQSIVGGGFNRPRGIALDGMGNIFVADGGNNAVDEISPTCSSSNCVVPLGNGFGFNSPRGMAVDGGGNLFVADSGNNAVEEIVAAGGYTTVKTLGGGFNNPYYLAVDGSGNVFVTEYNQNSSVKEIPPGCILSGCVQTLSGVVFGQPWGVAVDGSGNLFVTDHQNNTVSEIPAAGGYTTANPVGSGFNEPTGITVDGDGNVYVADWSNNAVKEIPAAGSYTTVNVLGNGLYGPEAVVVDGSGNVFVADSWNNRAVKMDFADAPGVTFPTPTVVGSADTTDGAQVVAVENAGNQPLSFSALTYPADFPETGVSDCAVGTPLGAGASCPLTMHFVPASAGAIADTLVLGDNSLTPSGSTQTIALTGTGVAAFAKYGFAGLPANLALGTPQGFTLTAENSSGATLPSYTGTAQLGSSDSGAVFALTSGGAPIASYAFVPADSGVRSLYVTFETAGSQSISATDAAASVSSSSAGVLLSQTTPTITWASPSAITYGVALGTTQLNATASVAGTFTYTPAAGSVLTAGAQTLSVVFTPTDATDYSTANGSVSLTVNKANASVTPNPGSKPYGASEPALGGTLSGFLPADGVTATYSRAPGETVAGGPYTISATLSPAGVLGNYNVTYNTASFTIGKATASVTPNSNSKPYGALEPALGGVLSGFVPADGVTATYSRAPGETVAGGPYTISATLSPAGVLGNYNVTYNTSSFTIGKATLTATANNATMAYGGALPDLTGTLVGVVPGDGITASFTTAVTSSTPVGSYAITPVLADPEGKLGNYNAVLNGGTLAVGIDLTTTTVTSSALTVLAQNNVVFTAKVSSAVKTPVGSVSFLDGNASLGTATLDNTGTATLTLATLGVGAHSITAVYAGNADFVGSTSGALTETVESFNFTVSGTTVTALSSSVQPGSSAVYTLQLSPTSGATFAGAVTLTLTGSPAGATYTISPATIAAGSGVTTVTVTVNTSKAQAAAASPSSKDGGGLPKPLLMVLFLPLLGMGKVRRALRAQMKSPMLMLAVLGVMMAAGMTACGSGGGVTQPAESYQMTLTGTSGGLHHSVTLNLTVE